jgi:arylsulfatase
MKEAVKYSVLPLDDRSIERFNPAIAGRPDLMGGRTSLTVYDGMTGILENAFINVKNRSHTITAEVEIPSGGANGVVIAQAGRFAGWSLYLKDGKPAYVHNWIGRERYTVTASEPIPPGKATIRLDFTYDGGGLGKGATATLSVGGQKVAEGRIEHTVPLAFSGDEGADVGVDEATPVTDAYKEDDNRFTGKIHKVTIELQEVKAADKNEAEKSHKEAALKKGLSD